MRANCPVGGLGGQMVQLEDVLQAGGHLSAINYPYPYPYHPVSYTSHADLMFNQAILIFLGMCLNICIFRTKEKS